jgi:hypothetical protein
LNRIITYKLEELGQYRICAYKIVYTQEPLLSGLLRVLRLPPPRTYA